MSNQILTHPGWRAQASRAGIHFGCTAKLAGIPMATCVHPPPPDINNLLPALPFSSLAFVLSFYSSIPLFRQPNGTPALFIPGNAGSSHQVRSIASSATRQFYSAPFQPNPEFVSRGMKPLDVFAGPSRSFLFALL